MSRLVSVPPDRTRDLPEANKDRGAPPMLEWWRGIYDHVFIALHPFCRGPADWRPGDYWRAEDLKQAEPVRWAEVASEIGQPAFEPFALAVTFPCFGISMDTYVLEAPVPDEDLIRRLKAHIELVEGGLGYPWTDSISPMIEAQLASAYMRLGAHRLTAWSEFKDKSVEVSSEIVTSLSTEWREFAFRAPCALRDNDCQMLVCSEWEDAWSTIALTDAARAVVRPETVFEGFYARQDTPYGWVISPGTYDYPDWLRENTNAA